MYGLLESIETSDGQKVPGFPVLIEASESGPKAAVLRLPKPEEILSYLAAQKSVYRDLGRRQGEGEDLQTPDADQKFFRAIRLDKGPDFDDAEAQYALTQILRHKVDSCERDGQAYVITLKTIFGATVHTVKIPFQKDLAEYKRNVYKSRDLPHGIEERRFPPDVPCKLYDKIVSDTKGYAEGAEVPPHHKRSVIVELVSTLASLDPSLDPNS